MFTVIALLIVPAILIGVTIALFSANPVSILACMAAMIAGSFYLLTYNETFA